MPELPLCPFFNARWVAPQCRLCPSHCHRLRETLCQVRGFGDICHFSESPVAPLAAWVEGRAGRRVCAPGEEQREVEEEGHVRVVGSERVVGMIPWWSCPVLFYGLVAQLPWASAKGGLKMWNHSKSSRYQLLHEKCALISHWQMVSFCAYCMWIWAEYRVYRSVLHYIPVCTLRLYVHSL